MSSQQYQEFRTLSSHSYLFSQSHKIAKSVRKWSRTQTDCFRIVFVWTSQGLNLGPPDYEPQITILYDTL